MAKSTYFVCAVFLTLVATIMQAIAIGTPNWLVLSYEGVAGIRNGLWQSCTELLGLVTCEEESNFRGKAWFIAVQVLESLGLAFTVISLILSLVLLVVLSSNFLVKVNINLCSIGGSCIGIGLTIFAIKTMTGYSMELGYHFGYSYWLALAAMILLFIVVILLWFDKRRHREAVL